MRPYSDRLEGGSPYPTGASFDGLGANFAIFSAHAEKIELCVRGQFDGLVRYADDRRAPAMRRAIALDDGRIEAITMLMTASDDTITFTLPAPSADRQVLIDSAQPDLEPVAVGNNYEVQPHAAVLIRWIAEQTGE